MQFPIGMSQASLHLLPLIPRQFQDLSTTTSPLTFSSLAVWDFILKKFHWNYNCPLMPL